MNVHLFYFLLFILLALICRSIYKNIQEGGDE